MDFFREKSMSLSVYIYLVRGVKLQEQDLCVEGKPQCSHKIPEAANFCPVCGKTVARQWEKRPEYKDVDGEPTLCGFNVVRGGTDYNDIYVGEIVGKKVIPGTGTYSKYLGIYWGIDHGCFMNFPFGTTGLFHFDAKAFFVDLARMLDAYSL